MTTCLNIITQIKHGDSHVWFGEIRRSGKVRRLEVNKNHITGEQN
jgi:hypothetical protein